MMSYSKCYLSNDFSKEVLFTDSGLIVAPEALLNGVQIRDWVAQLKVKPQAFATCSLYLLRELHLQEIHVEYIKLQGGRSFDINDLDGIEILERELEQSDRYINHEFAKQT